MAKVREPFPYDPAGVSSSDPYGWKYGDAGNKFMLWEAGKAARRVVASPAVPPVAESAAPIPAPAKPAAA